MNAPKPGDLLDNRYRLVLTLATGGFGQTYLAEDTRRPGNPICVVKHLTPTSNDPRYLENATRLFLTEAQTLERLGIIHDQIPRLLAYFEENREFYLVQDWIDGHTLSDELQSGQHWSETKVCQMFHEVLKILQFIHGFGVIHRDIKPDNLIRRRQDDRLVLVDFGTVKQIRSQILTPGQINANATIAVGTPGYMPTEQGRGNPRPNSDIYALGIIGIQAVTGLHPTQFQEDNDTGEIIWRSWAQISEELASIITKMVRYHFKDRYQSATDALQALEPLLTRVLPASPHLGVTRSRQTPVIPQPTQFSSQSSGNPVTEPQPTQFSSQPSGNPVTEPQPTQFSSQPTGNPIIVEPQPTQFSSQPTGNPIIVEPQPTQFSSQPTGNPVTEPQPTQFSFQPTGNPVTEPQPTQFSSQPTGNPVTEPQPTQFSSQPTRNPIIVEPQPTQFSSQPSGSPIIESQPAQTFGMSTMQRSEEEDEEDSVASFSGLSVPKEDLQLSYTRSLQQAAILGTSSWLLAIFVVSILGTIWLSAIFWLIILGIFIFKFFIKKYPLFDKYSVFGIAVISSTITFLFLPHHFLLKGLLQAGLPGLLVTLLLAIFAGVLAFILIILYQVFEQNQN
ncbi:protein kinase domain-containing protein [Scytonema sp. NUACC26]|uniref:protein kinase domain-containing protein n=1 Tax=Scytonema sp. NUACC26 TaxID=3140176 RepID=UPI0034DC0CBE